MRSTATFFVTDLWSDFFIALFPPTGTTMIKKLFFPVCFLLLYATGYGQSAGKLPNIGLKWAPTGIALGSINLQGEYNFGKNSLTAKIGIPFNKKQTFEFDDKDTEFTMRAISFLAGYRTYLSNKHMKGLYFEPYFKYVHHTSEGSGSAVLDGDQVAMNFTNDYNGVGVGAELGVQFMIGKKFLIDFFFLGPEINSARNNFKAVEASTTIPWNSIKASEAEQDIREFIDQFPFIRKKVDVMVDQNNKTVIAKFKGALPGYRIGVSFGYAF